LRAGASKDGREHERQAAVADENQPKTAFTPEQIESLNSMMGQTVNNILTARLKTSEKQLLEKLGGTVGESLKAQLPELLKEFKPAAADPDDKDGKGKGRRAEDVVEMATLRKQIQDLNARAEKADQKAAEAVAKTRTATLKQTTAEKLSAMGIDGARFKGAYALLQQEGRIKHRDDDSDDMVFVDDTGVELDIDVGLQGWAKGEDAKIFLPPSGVKGSGSKPVSSTPAASGGKPTSAQQWEIVGNAIRDRLSEL
jgi:hypothetical protein